MTIIIGHATFCVVIAYNNVVARLRRLPRSPEEASADLGADTWITFRRITMPGMRTALLSGALLAFALSFDEVIVTLFTAGAGTQTIPLFVLAAMQRPTELPVVNVVALVLHRVQRDPGLHRPADQRSGRGGRGPRLTFSAPPAPAWARERSDRWAAHRHRARACARPGCRA